MSVCVCVSLSLCTRRIQYNNNINIVHSYVIILYFASAELETESSVRETQLFSARLTIHYIMCPSISGWASKARRKVVNVVPCVPHSNEITFEHNHRHPRRVLYFHHGIWQTCKSLFIPLRASKCRYNCARHPRPNISPGSESVIRCVLFFINEIRFRPLAIVSIA